MINFDTRAAGAARTYFIKGSKEMAQTMALTPPITSSCEGAAAEAGQIPFSTYSGDVPMKA